eukprot:6214379-Pleurochrysis_carterae.AAC.2
MRRPRSGPLWPAEDQSHSVTSERRRVRAYGIPTQCRSTRTSLAGSRLLCIHYCRHNVTTARGQYLVGCRGSKMMLVPCKLHDAEGSALHRRL